MTMEVLQSKEQIREARTWLRRESISIMPPGWRTWLARRGLLRGDVLVGDYVKSWDVAKTAQFLRQHVSKDQPVLDIGAYASEIPPILKRLGYTAVAGVDLNPGIRKMPYADAIDYRVGDFLRAPYADATFSAVTAISVIEHGLDARRLVAEMGRLLRPGGFFIASFDYWPDKIATDGITMFDMSWTIFSRSDVQNLVSLAFEYGLDPVGKLEFEGSGRPVSCAGKDYTFAWLVLRRRP